MKSLVLVMLAVIVLVLCVIYPASGNDDVKSSTAPSKPGTTVSDATVTVTSTEGTTQSGAVHLCTSFLLPLATLLLRLLD